MKKVTALILLIVLAISLLTSCGGKSDSKTGTASSAPKTSNSANSSTAPANSSAPPALNDSGSSPDGGSNVNTAPEEDSGEITPLKLVSVKDAERILGVNMTIGDLNDKRLFGGKQIKTEYVDDGDPDVYLKVSFLIAANYSSDNSYEVQYDLLREREDSIDVNGIGEKALYLDNELYVYDRDYFMRIQVLYTSLKVRLTDEEEAAWTKEKAIEWGKLAAERLEALI